VQGGGRKSKPKKQVIVLCWDVIQILFPNIPEGEAQTKLMANWERSIFVVPLKKEKKILLALGLLTKDGKS